jgi:hypothetical protein
MKHRRLWALYDLESEDGATYDDVGSTIALYDQALEHTTTTNTTAIAFY